MTDARKRAEEWLADYDAVVKALPLGSVDTTEVRLLRALLASEPAKVSGSVSIVRSDDPPAKPLPTCVNCGSNFITPAPAPDAVREAAERLRGSLHATLDPMNLLQYVWPIQRAAFDLLAALDARRRG